MASSIGSTFRSLWHTMTSNDRHATIDSPYRTGRHVPLSNRETLTSIASASNSRADVSSPYFEDAATQSTPPDGPAAHGSPYAPPSPTRGSRPYSPGLRSASAQRSSQDGPSEIQMLSFEDGAAPAPPVSHSWAKIDSWAEENYPELFDQLCEGATSNDLNELEHQLDCSLPQDVRESLMIHDGQERGGRPTGIIFGSMLLDCEEMVHELENWKTVNQEFLDDASLAQPKPPVPSRAFGGGGSSSQASSSKTPPSPLPALPAGAGPNPSWRHDLMSRQDCVPHNSIKKVYAHPAWIPLVRDWGGNNLAVDLSPGPNGRWGQIILFGRDYDTKYVVARSWAAFVAAVADDLGSGKWFVDEDSNELKLREFKESRVEPPYFSILRWRVDQRYGRRAPNKRMSMRSPATGASSPRSSRSVSPYASPTEPPAASPLPSSTRLGFPPKPSPLGRVQEEGGSGPSHLDANGTKPGKLVEVETPRPSEDLNALKLPGLSPTTTFLTDASSAVSSDKEKEKEPVTEMKQDDGMKTIRF